MVWSPVASGVPYWRLSGLYFIYFLIVGAFVPFWASYLQSRGCSGTEIGVAIAIGSLSRIVAPNVWGWIADRTSRHVEIIRLGAILCMLFFVGVVPEPSYLLLLAFVAAYSFFWNAILPQFEVITLHALGTQADRYTLVRVWGSISFILAVMALGALFDHVSIRHLPYVVLALMIALFAFSLFLPTINVGQRQHERVSLRKFVLERSMLVFLVASFLVQMAHGAFYSFFTLRMESLQYSRSMIGVLWSLGVVAEVLLFLMLPRWFTRFGLRQWFLASVAAGVLRWWVIACWPDHLALLLIAQLAHAATFAVLHVVAVQYVYQHFPVGVAGQGQALYSAVSYGAGGAAGNLVSGALWDHVSASGPFLMAAAVTALALLIAFTGFRPEIASDAK